MASGSRARHSARDASTTGSRPRPPATRATSSSTDARAAARASQRSCSRSTPRARRNRTTSDPAATSSESATTAIPASAGTSSTRASAGTARALPWYSGASGSGWTASPTIVTTGATAATLAHQHQRDEGSLPVGVSSSTKPAQDRATKKLE
ncbi:MAG TPA: hypothetical protein VFS70_22205 [Actinomycetota bacterium]|nr:hypothetical protein [Actinomycetota bacterium]